MEEREEPSGSVPVEAGGRVARWDGVQQYGALGGDGFQLTLLLQPGGDHTHSQSHHHGNCILIRLRSSYSFITIFSKGWCLFFLDGFAVGSYPANYSEGEYNSVSIKLKLVSLLVEIAFLTVFWFLKACKDSEARTSCREWLKGSLLGEQLLGLTEELCKVGRSSASSTTQTSNPSWTLISLVLSQNSNSGKYSLRYCMKFLSVWQTVDISKVLLFCALRVFDRGGVHGENVREAPHHSVWGEESVWRWQHGATYLLHLRRGFVFLLLRTGLPSAPLCWGAPADSLQADRSRSKTHSLVR